MTVVRFVWEDWADQELGLPFYATTGAAGADLRANFEDRGSVEIAAGARALISTGLRVAVPDGFEMQLRPRSGLALKHGITLPNSPGTIDSDYRGPLGVIVMNAGDVPFVVAHGDRICQAVVAPVVQVQFEVVSDLDDTARGQGALARPEWRLDFSFAAFGCRLGDWGRDGCAEAATVYYDGGGDRGLAGDAACLARGQSGAC